MHPAFIFLVHIAVNSTRVRACLMSKRPSLLFLLFIRKCRRRPSGGLRILLLHRLIRLFLVACVPGYFLQIISRQKQSRKRFIRLVFMYTQRVFVGSFSRPLSPFNGTRRNSRSLIESLADHHQHCFCHLNSQKSRMWLTIARSSPAEIIISTFYIDFV